MAFLLRLLLYLTCSPHTLLFVRISSCAALELAEGTQGNQPHYNRFDKMKRSREAEDGPDIDCPATAESSDSDYSDEPPASKYAEIEPSDQDGAGIAMKCSLPGHKEVLSFKTYDEYQSHYQKAHTNRCLECQRNFPSSHFLAVHIEECHDSFIAVKRDKGEHTVRRPLSRLSRLSRLFSGRPR